MVGIRQAAVHGDQLKIVMDDGSVSFLPPFGMGMWRGGKSIKDTIEGGVGTPSSGGADIIVTREMIEAGCKVMQAPERYVKGGSYQGIADLFNEAVKRAAPGLIDTKYKAAIMVGQSCQEVGGFTLLVEQGAQNAPYAPYYGRGWIQVTWADNYRSFGRYAERLGLITDPNQFVNNPDSLAVLKYAPYTTLWEFTQPIWSSGGMGNTLLHYCNADENNWRRISRAINRGNINSQYPAYGEELRLRVIRAILAVTPDPPKQVSGAKVWPLREGTYSLGARWGATGSWASYHTGQDFPAATGTPLYAVTDGVVLPPAMTTYTGQHHTVIKADNGETFSYWHCSARFVNTGDRVKAGQKIAAVGNEGRSFGPHLHFEYFPAGIDYTDIYKNVDPMKWLAGAKKW